MIRKTHFQLKQNNEELFSEESESNDFRCLYADSDSLIANKLPWHWHTAFEIDYIAGCDVEFHFAGDSFLVPHGNAVFINAGEVHSYSPQKSQGCKVYAILFEPVFLAGNYNNAIFEKYITPIINSKITSLLISQGTVDFQGLIKRIEKMIQLCVDEPDYYEFLLRSELSECWCGIMESLQGKNIFIRSKWHDNERVRKMMYYIHSNYSRRISLSDIASAAIIGTRECSRCFHRSIGCSPMDYLTDYRIQIAIQQLATTNYSITEISENCGFSSISYFGKIFKQHTGRSPLQYRASISKPK